MRTLNLDLPEEVLSALKRSPEDFVKEMRIAAAVYWYSRAELSQQTAADLAGLDRTDFLMTLGRLKVDAFVLDGEELYGESVFVPEASFVDASPLIYLSRWITLDVLRVSKDVSMPAAVADEIRRRGPTDPAVQALAGTPWLKVVPDPTPSASIVECGLGRGAAVLACAVARPGAAAIVDDLVTRRCAAKHGVRCIGTLGLVLNARRRGQIRAARPVVTALRASGMYISDAGLDGALSLVGE